MKLIIALNIKSGERPHEALIRLSEPIKTITSSISGEISGFASIIEDSAVVGRVTILDDVMLKQPTIGLLQTPMDF